MSKRLELFLIETEFHVDELSQKFKNQMIKEYLACRRIPIFTGYNAEFYHKDYTPIIAEKFLQVVHEYFDVGELLKPIKTWAYVQNKDRFDSVWHHHITTSSVNAVFYIDPPQKGGELELCIGGGEYFKITPKPNTLYLFPYWLFHRVLPQEDTDWRISINLEYFCRERPILKKNGIYW